MEAVDRSDPSFVVVTEPVLSTTPLPSGQTPPVDASVPEVMWTVNVLASLVVPAGTVTPFVPPQERTPEAIVQLVGSPQPAPVSAIFQDRPGLVGSSSDSLTPYASPLPSL